MYTAVTVLTAAFGAIYELFSHGIYSYYMLYAFAFPLLLGVLPFAVMALYGHYPEKALTRQLYHASVATATVGCIFEGILEIYGTSSPLSIAYTVGAFVLFVAAILKAIVDRFS